MGGKPRREKNRGWGEGKDIPSYGLGFTSWPSCPV